MGIAAKRTDVTVNQADVPIAGMLALPKRRNDTLIHRDSFEVCVVCALINSQLRLGLLFDVFVLKQGFLRAKSVRVMKPHGIDVGERLATELVKSPPAPVLNSQLFFNVVD